MLWTGRYGKEDENEAYNPTPTDVADHYNKS